MKLQINNETKFKDLQKVFSNIYPYLKIEFYSKPHREKELSAKKDRIAPNEIISEWGKFKNKGTVKINKERTVAELEAEFYDKFGIALQVSRRSGDLWIETSLTDDRTLDVQNQQGMMATEGEKNTVFETGVDS